MTMAPPSQAPDLVSADLDRRLSEASAAYHQGAPTMTDQEWDGMREVLRRRWPDAPSLRAVGAPPPADSRLAKVRHRIPMGSLSNAFTAADIRAWIDRVRRQAAEVGVPAPTSFVLQPKMDGLSVELVYRDGKLRHAITRGDGEVGEDVTHNVMHANGLPLDLVDVPARLSVRGEVVVHREDMRHFPGAKNPRNTAAGTVRRLDGDGARYLTFYAFTAIADDGVEIAATEAKTVAQLAAWGFQTARCAVVAGDDAEEDILAAWQAFEQGRRDLPYDCDGYVVKVSSRARSVALGEVDGCPRAMLAMKWPGSMQAETAVRGVELSVGRSGSITPVAVFEPVDCGGVTVSRASLMNWDEVDRLGVAIGARVRIERSGEVIPRCIAVLSVPDGAVLIARPMNCPVCRAETVEDGPRQVCPNADCAGRTFRAVLNYVTQRNIMFVGDDTVDRLMAVGGPLANIPDLYRLPRAALELACGGRLMADKITASIEKSRDVTLSELMGSVGIPRLGQTDAGKLVAAFGTQDPNEFLTILISDPDRVSAVRGFGPARADAYQRGATVRQAMLRDLFLQIRVQATNSGPLSGKSFCATGASDMSREQIIALIRKAGGEWRSTVVNGLDYLIMSDPNSTSIKAEAARKKGVKCISEQDLLAMIPDHGQA